MALEALNTTKIPNLGSIYTGAMLEGFKFITLNFFMVPSLRFMALPDRTHNDIMMQ